jgi:hypothetical protein
MSELERPTLVDERFINVDVLMTDDLESTEDCPSGVVTVLKDVSGQLVSLIDDFADEIFCDLDENDNGEDEDDTQILNMKEIIGEEYSEADSHYQKAVDDLFGDRKKNEVTEGFRLDLVEEDD